MKLALIPPYSLLERTAATNYQLCLPQCLDESSRYKLFYKKYGADPNQFVILDNGAAEGVEYPVELLADYASMNKFDEVVIPDVIGDMNGTLEKAEKFLKDMVPPRGFRPLPFRLMFVVQGQTFMEVLKCADWALNQSWIDTLGIPRHMLMTLSDPTARSRIVNMLSSKHHPKPMHMLGGSPINPMEIRALTDPFRTEQKYLRGMDTSVPISFAINGHEIDNVEPAVTSGHRVKNYFKYPAEQVDRALVTHNVKQLLTYTDRKHVA